VHDCDACSSHILSLIALGVLSLSNLPVALCISTSSREIGGGGGSGGGGGGGEGVEGAGGGRRGIGSAGGGGEI